MKYEVNICISAGSPFRQEFYVTNPDLSPTDITGAKITAYIAKHPRALYATESTSDHIFWNYLPFTCLIDDGPAGVFSLSMEDYETILLEEGKYVYSASILTDGGLNLGSVVSGSAFVEFDMNPIIGSMGPQNDSQCIGY